MAVDNRAPQQRDRIASGNLNPNCLVSLTYYALIFKSGIRSLNRGESPSPQPARASPAEGGGGKQGGFPGGAGNQPFTADPPIKLRIRNFCRIQQNGLMCTQRPSLPISTAAAPAHAKNLKTEEAGPLACCDSKTLVTSPLGAAKRLLIGQILAPQFHFWWHRKR